MVDAMVAGSSPDLYYEYYPYQDPYQCPIRPDQYGPVTVPLVSTSSSPPMAMPVQVPHGHVVQQIVDESGTLRHVFLSPQHHPPILPIPQHFAGGTPNTGANNGAQGFYPGHMPPHGFGPFSPIQPPGVIPQHPQGHSPPPMNFHKDERTQRQYNKLKRKLEQKQLRDNSSTTPPLSPRKELNGICKKGVNSVGTSEDGEESSSLQDEEEDLNVLIDLLGSIKAPQVSEVTSRTALVQWVPPAVDQRQDVRYEVLLSDRAKEGKYKSIYSGEALSCRIEDLRPGTEYSLCVSARLDQAVGRPSDPELLLTPPCPPDPPSQPKLASRTRNALTLKWQAGSDNGAHIEHYLVEREMEGGEWSEVARTKSRQTHITKLQPATPFRFRVAAVNHLGKSDYCPSVVYETCDSPPPQPNPPALLQARHNTLSLNWVARPQDDEFTLQMEDPNSGHGYLAVYCGKETSHTCTSLAVNTTYKFRLKSQNEEGSSRWSDEVCYSTLVGRPNPPSRPQLKGKVLPTSFRIRWDPPQETGGTPILAYTVHLLQYNSSQAEDQLVYRGPETWCQVDKLRPATVYQARVRCEAEGGTSDPSEPGLFATEPGCPSECDPPTIASRPKPRTVPLKWSYPKNDGGSPVTELELAIRTDEKVDKFKTAYRGRDCECTVTGLKPATTYYFLLRAHNKIGVGLWSQPVKVLTASSAPGRPATPSVTATSSPTSLNVSWTAPPANGSPISHYVLHQATPPCHTFNRVYSGPGTSCEVKSLPYSTLCCFRVKAVNSIGASEWSDLGTSMTQSGPPNPVSNLKAEPAATSLQLTWTAPEDNGDPITHYTVESAELTTSVAEPSCLLENLASNTSYKVRVKAVNAVGSGPSSSLRVSTMPLPPAAPVLSSTALTHSYVKLKWAASNLDNLHYTLYMSPSPHNRRSVVYEGTSTSTKVSRLQEQTEYTFTIVAANATGKGPESSPFSLTTAVAPPPPVKGLKVNEVNHRSCQVEWLPQRTTSNSSSAESNIEYVVQCTRLRENNYKQVYRGCETRCAVKDLEPGADYLVRVGTVRLSGSSASDSRVDNSSFSSPPTSFSTPSHHHHHHHQDPSGHHSSKHLQGENGQHQQHQWLNRRNHHHQQQPLSDQQWAGIILSAFTVLALVVAMFLANLLY